MEHVITYMIVGAVVGMIMYYLNKSASTKTVPIQGDSLNLRLHKLYWYFGMGSIALGIAWFLLPGLTVEDGSGWLIGLLLLLLFGGLGSICVLWYVNHTLSFDSERIESKSVFGKTTSIPWKEIENISFSALSGLLTFEDGLGEKVNVYAYYRVNID